MASPDDDPLGRHNEESIATADCHVIDHDQLCGFTLVSYYIHAPYYRYVHSASNTHIWTYLAKADLSGISVDPGRQIRAIRCSVADLTGCLEISGAFHVTIFFRCLAELDRFLFVASTGVCSQD